MSVCGCSRRPVYDARVSNLSTQESGVGKTCLVNRFVSDVFTEHESLTVGCVQLLFSLVQVPVQKRRRCCSRLSSHEWGEGTPFHVSLQIPINVHNKTQIVLCVCYCSVYGP